MHYTETTLSSNTVNLANISLPNHSNTYLYGLKDNNLEDNYELNRLRTPLFLYPEEGAIPITLDILTSEKENFELIIPDGNWRQAKKIKRRVYLFKSLPSYTLIPGEKSKYQLRKQKQDHHLSTFEAMAQALKVLEGEEVFQLLMENFDLMVKTNLYCRKGRILSESKQNS